VHDSIAGKGVIQNSYNIHVETSHPFHSINEGIYSATQLGRRGLHRIGRTTTYASRGWLPVIPEACIHPALSLTPNLLPSKGASLKHRIKFYFMVTHRACR